MSVFISYEKEDRAAAEAVKAAIERAGGRVWLAPVSMVGDQAFAEEIAQAIADCSALAVICSPRSERSKWVVRELNHGVANGKRLVPIVIESFSKSGALHLFVGPIDWIEAYNGFTPDVCKLVAERTVRRGLGRVITTLNLKGGVGKTTLTANIAAEAHFQLGHSVLFIDLDPQYNLTQYFLSEKQIDPLRESGRTVLNLLDMKNTSPAEIARVRDRCFSLLSRTGERGAATTLDLLPGHDDLFAYTIDERSRTEMDRALANLAAFVGACRPFYNIILIDVNPSASFLTRCALSVSDHVMAPVRPERYALNGLRLLERLIARVRGKPFDSSEVSVVVNKMAERYSSASSDIVEQTRTKIDEADRWQGCLSPQTIPYSVTLFPSALDEAAEVPARMLARFSRASAELKSALLGTAKFVYGRAGVPYAR